MAGRPKNELIQVPCKGCGAIRTYKHPSRVREYCRKCSAEMARGQEKGEEVLDFDSEVAQIRYLVKDRKLTATGECEFEIPIKAIPNFITKLNGFNKLRSSDYVQKWANELIGIYDVWGTVRT